MSSDKEQDYFSDGISEELLNLLAKIPNLQVAARTSSFSFKGKEVEVPEIARQLHVAHVLEGSVRKSGSQIRITAQLIRADNGYHLWSETYDREFTDIFKLQDEIAGAVVAALKLKLLPGQVPAPTNPTTNTEAYNQYLLGNQYYNRPNPENFRRAIAAYRQAIALDPKFAQAYAALAFAEAYASDWEPTREAIAAAQQRAIAAAEQAVALAPGMAEGYSARGWVRRTLSRDWSGAQADFEQALALGPGRVDGQRLYGTLLASLNRTTEGIAALRKATELDPLSARAWTNLGQAHSYAGQLADAEEALNRALAINPESNIALFWLGTVRLMQNRAQDALPLFARAGVAFSQAGTAMAEHALGRANESQAALAELIAKFADGSAYQVAEAQAFTGQKDKAFEWLERARKQDDPGLAVVKADPLLASLRGDPRYAALLKQLGLPE